MKNFIYKLSVAYSAGTLGGLVNTLTGWIFGLLGITSALGVRMAPPLTKQWLYQRLVWGGLWGFIFLLPFLKGRPIVRGLVFGIAPALVQLFVVFPFLLQRGLAGLELGTLTPLFVFLFNFVWGITASLWLAAVEEKAPWRFRIWR